MLIENVGKLAPDQRIIVAYEDMSLDEAAVLHTQFNKAGFQPIAKVHSLATRPGLDAVMARFDGMGSQVMLDAKYHDTDNTMRTHINVVASAEPATPLMVTLHTSNKMPALKEAVKARNETVGAKAEVLSLLGVTILSTFEDRDVASKFGQGATVESKFVEFAHDAKEAGLQGLVSSGEELVKSYEFEELNGLLRVIANIVLPDTPVPSGQKRPYTPDAAISEGAHFVVIGRAITNSKEPVAALEQAVELVARAA